jgi:outer membrane biosynthesis protein TonB
MTSFPTILILLLGLTVPVQPPLECVDAKGRIVIPASTIRQVGQGVSRPEIIQQIQPMWPEETRPFGITILEAVIDTSGKVCAVRILKTPSKAIGEAVVAALRASRFRPARSKGQAVPVRYFLTVTPHPQ